MLNSEVIQTNCIGCGLCASVNENIIFEINSEGYYRPIFPSDYNYKELEIFCPIVYGKNESIDKIWGNYIEVNKSYANDEIVNKKASSGGVISSILIWLLEKGKVDGVIQIGSSDTNPLKNKVFLSTSKEEVLKCAGSRYSPASPLISIKELLDKDRKYVFVGKPCDCRALRKYLNSYENFMAEIVLYISFFCAGTPSEKATVDLIHKMGADERKVRNISYRGNGWPGYATVVDSNGSYQMDYEESWGKILGRNKQQFCRICPDGTGESADISCGDAWNLTDNKKPDFSEANGRNVVFLRTEKGIRIFDDCLKDGVVSKEQFPIESLRYIQPYQYERKATLISQVVALRIFRKYTPNLSTKNLIKLSKNVPIKRVLSIFKGTVQRIRKGIIQ